MKEMLRAMEEINLSSGSIGKIIKVIDDIASRRIFSPSTPLSKRPGPDSTGRGLPSWLRRSGIWPPSPPMPRRRRRISSKAPLKPWSGVPSSQQDAAALEKIISTVTKAAELIEDITHSSEEQSVAIKQINQGITEVSQIVQNAAALAEESAATSEELSGQAAFLQEQTSYFKVSGSGAAGGGIASTQGWQSIEESRRLSPPKATTSRRRTTVISKSTKRED